MGATYAEVDDAARAVISDAGHAERFGHGLGHGVGLDIHAVLFLGAMVVGDRTPVTVEPGVYLPGARRGPHRGHPRGPDRRARVTAASFSSSSGDPDQETIRGHDANDLKKGLVLHSSSASSGPSLSPARQARQRPGTKLKAVLSGKVVDKTFNAGVKVETANVDGRDFQYLYRDGERPVLMDTSSYDQVHVPDAVVGQNSRWMLQVQLVILATHDGVPLYIELPASVELLITYTEPGLQGDRSTAARRPGCSKNWCRDRRPAVHREQHPRQGRHPRRVVPRPR